MPTLRPFRFFDYVRLADGRKVTLAEVPDDCRTATAFVPGGNVETVDLAGAKVLARNGADTPLQSPASNLRKPTMKTAKSTLPVPTVTPEGISEYDCSEYQHPSPCLTGHRHTFDVAQFVQPQRAEIAERYVDGMWETFERIPAKPGHWQAEDQWGQGPNLMRAYMQAYVCRHCGTVVHVEHKNVRPKLTTPQATLHKPTKEDAKVYATRPVRLNLKRKAYGYNATTRLAISEVEHADALRAKLPALVAQFGFILS